MAVSAWTQQAGVGDQDDAVEAVGGAVVALERESCRAGENGGAMEAELDRVAERDVSAVGELGPFDRLPLVDTGGTVGLEQVTAVIAVDGGVTSREAGQQLNVGGGGGGAADGDRLAGQQQESSNPVDPQQVPALVGRARFSREWAGGGHRSGVRQAGHRMVVLSLRITCCGRAVGACVGCRRAGGETAERPGLRGSREDPALTYASA
ncbi:MAG TPA: hypothetical protein DCE47_21270 [Planctomycetaceae bacterium]|nr:hypothetical protein [Planctomycetaceae bacterium]